MAKFGGHTSGTRYGKGKGHGGPARGVGIQRETIQTAPPFEPGNCANPHGRVGGYRAIARRERIEVLKEALWDDAFNADLPQRDRHAARTDLLNREEGLPVARVVQTDDADKWFVEGVPEAKTAEEWQEQYSLATAAPKGSGD